MQIQKNNSKVSVDAGRIEHQQEVIAQRQMGGQPAKPPQKNGQNPVQKLGKKFFKALRNEPGGCWVEAERDVNDAVVRGARYAVPCPASETIASNANSRANMDGYFYDSIQGWVSDPTNNNPNNPHYSDRVTKKSKPVSREEAVEEMRAKGYFYDSIEGWVFDPTNNNPNNPNYMKRIQAQ